MGEALVEIMRTDVNMPLNATDLFRGPFPSGSSAIMASTVARMGHSAGIISGVGKDEFGECILNRLKQDGVDISKVLWTQMVLLPVHLYLTMIKETADFYSIGMKHLQQRQKCRM